MIKLSLYFGLWLLWSCNATEFGGRIIGGRESQPEDAFSVTIYSLVSVSGVSYLSSGVAISPRLVLGTAQAIQSFADGTLVVYDTFGVGFDSIIVANQIRFPVQNAIEHPNYNPETLAYNIAAFHLLLNPITIYLPVNFVGTTPLPIAIKIHGYGAPDADTSFSSELLTTIGSVSTDCSPVLNSMVYGETNQCLQSVFPLAQGDQGGPVTNSWLTHEDISLFGIVSYWTRSEPRMVIMTDLKHPDISNFIEQQMQDSKSS